MDPEFFHRATAYQVLRHHAFEDIGRAGVIPHTVRIYHGHRAAQTHARQSAFVLRINGASLPSSARRRFRKSHDSKPTAGSQHFGLEGSAQRKICFFPRPTPAARAAVSSSASRAMRGIHPDGGPVVQRRERVSDCIYRSIGESAPVMFMVSHHS